MILMLPMLTVMNQKTLQGYFLSQKTSHITISLNMQKITTRMLLENFSVNLYFQH